MRLGIKAHWRDVDAMAAIARKHGATVLEYQMLPGDVERNAQRAFDAFLPYRGEFELRVHQPEAFLVDGKPRFLDISSPDPAAREESVRVLGEVARHAMELRAKALVIHPGGVWLPGEVGGSPELLRDGLQDLPRHVKLLLENMPHAYDLRNVGLPNGHSPAAFRIPGGLAQVGDLVDGYVLDISHAYLAVPGGSEAVVRAFCKELGPRVLHVHAAGSRGIRRIDESADSSDANGSRAGRPDGEGTPFLDSDYGADLVREVLSSVSPDAVIVPEIMDGHKDGGRKFDEGLAFLRALLA